MPAPYNLSRRQSIMLLGGAVVGGASAAGTFSEIMNDAETNNYTLNTGYDDMVTFSFDEEEDISLILEGIDEEDSSEARLTAHRSGASYEADLGVDMYESSEVFGEDLDYLPDFEVKDIDTNDDWTGISLEFDKVLDGKYSRT